MIFTFLALTGAVVASYTDLKQGLISNKLTFGLFAAGMFGHLLINGRDIIFPLLSSVVLIFILGYGFWSIGGWSAGDAKEFLFIAALLPEYPGHLEGTFSPALPSYPFVLTVFINTFVAIFPFILLWGIYTALKQGGLYEVLAPIKDFKDTSEKALIFTGAVLLVLLLHIWVLLALPIVLLSYRLAPRIRYGASVLLALLYWVVTHDPIFIARYFAGVVLAIIIFRLLWNAISVIRKNALQMTVSANNVKEGMVLQEAVDAGNGKIETGASGLSNEDVERIKKLHQKGKLEVIRIKKTTPFAPVILIGLVISLTIGDLLMVMSNG